MQPRMKKPRHGHSRGDATDPGATRGLGERRRAADDPQPRPSARKPDQWLQLLRRLGLAREAPYFSDAERAALALAEAVTRLSDRADPVPDDIWDEAARHFDEKGLAALLLMIATTNVFNRLNVPTRQVAGAWG